MTHPWGRGGAILAILLVAALLLVPLPESWHGRWQSKFFDLGHVPLFAALTLGLWFALGRRWPWPALLSVLVAGLAELVQDYFGRTGNWEDFVRGALGVAAAVVLIHAGRPPRTWVRLAAHALLLMALVAWPVLDCGPFLVDAAEAAAAFPTLADFSTERQMRRWETHQAQLTRQNNSGRLELLPGPEEYPGATLEVIVRDWSGRQRLCCSFRVLGEPLVVVCSIRGRGIHGGDGHFQFEKTYAPGEHQVQRDLEQMARRDLPKGLDLRAVRSFQVFTYRPAEPRTLILHRVWLE